MNNLTQKKCIPCEGGLTPLARNEYEPYLEQLHDWSVIDDKQLVREFIFEDFNRALQFVNVAGEIAEEEGHHPDILIHSWNKVKIILWTHAIDGLSVNDFIMAAKIERITF